VVLDTFSKRKYAQVIGQAGGWEWFQSLLQVLDSIAQKHSTSLSNIATRCGCAVCIKGYTFVVPCGSCACC